MGGYIWYTKINYVHNTMCGKLQAGLQPTKCSLLNNTIDLNVCKK